MTLTQYLNQEDPQPQANGSVVVEPSELLSLELFEYEGEKIYRAILDAGAGPYGYLVYQNEEGGQDNTLYRSNPWDHPGKKKSKPTVFRLSQNPFK